MQQEEENMNIDAIYEVIDEVTSLTEAIESSTTRYAVNGEEGHPFTILDALQGIIIHQEDSREGRGITDAAGEALQGLQAAAELLTTGLRNMSSPLRQVEATTALITYLQQPNDDISIRPIHMLGTTITETDSPAEVFTREQRNRKALLTLAAAARTLITMIESEEARWMRSDEEQSKKAAKRQLERI
jgi:hypothetical protein